MSIFGKEPVAIANAIRLCVLAAITFGLDVTDVQLIAGMAALEAVLTLFARQAVTPNDTVDEHIDTALRLRDMVPRRDALGRFAPDDGQSFWYVAAVSFFVCIAVLLVFDLIA